MNLFQYHEDSLRLREAERKRDERGRRHLRELEEARSAAPPAGERGTHSRAATPPTPSYAGPERRMVPCPELNEAMTP